MVTVACTWVQGLLALAAIQEQIEQAGLELERQVRGRFPYDWNKKTTHPHKVDSLAKIGFGEEWLPRAAAA